jgi:hypothetical protein
MNTINVIFHVNTPPPPLGTLREKAGHGGSQQNWRTPMLGTWVCVIKPRMQVVKGGRLPGSKYSSMCLV